MELRCRPGDLAIIVREELGCEANIGRLVRVLRRAQPDNDSASMDEWWIDPINPEQPMYYVLAWKPVHKVEVGFGSVKHSDSWMIPLRDPDGGSFDESELGNPMTVPGVFQPVLESVEV